MEKTLKRYYQQKQKAKEIEQELSSLREELLAYCSEHEVAELEQGGHRLKVVTQERKEYDEQKLFDTLPDLELWRMLSRPDSAKIASLIKLGVIAEERIRHTYTSKTVKLVQVERM